MTDTIYSATVRTLLDRRGIALIEHERIAVSEVAVLRGDALLAMLTEGAITRQQAQDTLIALARHAAAGHDLPPTREAVEDIIELGRLARPIPADKLRAIAALPACQQIRGDGWDERTGTIAGYQSHLAAGEKTCPECRAARSAYVRALRRSDQ